MSDDLNPSPPRSPRQRQVDLIRDITGRTTSALGEEMTPEDVLFLIGTIAVCRIARVRANKATGDANQGSAFAEHVIGELADHVRRQLDADQVRANRVANALRLGAGT